MRSKALIMQKQFIYSIVSVLAVAATSQGVFAEPVFVFDGSENFVKFENKGIVLRADAGSSYGGLDGYRRVEIGTLGPDFLPAVGDIEIEIFTAQNTQNPEGTNLWFQSATDHFSAYAALEISKITVDVSGVVQVEYAPLSVADPFGILDPDLSKGEILALYVNDGPEAVTDWDPNGSSLGAGVTSTTDGDLWATFGFSGIQGTDGYLYQRNDQFIGNPESGVGFGALNAIRQPLISTAVFPGVNDSTETLFGGAALLTDIHVQQKFERNTRFDPTLAAADATWSFWQFSSDDPLVFAAVPEPSSLFLFSALFGGFLGFDRLRRKKTA